MSGGGYTPAASSWTPRAATLEDQAKAPFLNPLEMANTSTYQVVDKVRTAQYAGLFRRVYGADAFDDPDRAYERITLTGVVDFYNTRDTRAQCDGEFVGEGEALKRRCWPRAEEPSNVNRDELGNLRLMPQEVEDIVAFLHTLTDGWQGAGRGRN